MPVSLRELVAKVTPTARQVLEVSAQLCLSRTHHEMMLQHVILKMADQPKSDFAGIARHFQLDLDRLQLEVEQSLRDLETGATRNPIFGQPLINALSDAWIYCSLEQHAPRIRTGFLLLAALENPQNRSLLAASTELQKIDLNLLRTHYFNLIDRLYEDDPVPATSSHGDTKPSISPAPPSTPPAVFLSYRRKDNAFYADFLHASLTSGIPGVRVFRDQYTLTPGCIFSEEISTAIASSDILIAIIGRHWLGPLKGSSSRRIDLPEDWVRMEVAAAIRQNKWVIPCLIDGAKLPAADMLPPEIVSLSARQAVTLSRANLTRDAEALNEHIRTWHQKQLARRALGTG